MKIELNRIPTNGLEINQSIILDKSLYSNMDILDIKDLYLNGLINYDYDNNLVFNLKVNGIFILKDSVTNEAIDYPFECDINEKIENITEYYGEFYEKSKNMLDISEILWENIVLEIPISVSKTNSEELNLQGDGWELKNESVKKIDPRLAKLTELYDEREE